MAFVSPRANSAFHGRAVDLVDHPLVRIHLPGNQFFAETPGGIDHQLVEIVVVRVEGEGDTGDIACDLTLDDGREMGCQIQFSLGFVDDQARIETGGETMSHRRRQVRRGDVQPGLVEAGEGSVSEILLGRGGAHGDNAVPGNLGDIVECLPLLDVELKTRGPGLECRAPLPDHGDIEILRADDCRAKVAPLRHSGHGIDPRAEEMRGEDIGMWNREAFGDQAAERCCLATHQRRLECPRVGERDCQGFAHPRTVLPSGRHCSRPR